MPDLLHPAAPIVPCPPGVRHVDLDAVLRRAGDVPSPPLPIDLVEPDEPAPVGDRWPCHVFWAPLPDPLGPVLRPDAGRVMGAAWIRMPDGQWRRFTPDEVAAAMHRDVVVSARAVRRARLRRFWDAYHEWIAVAVILAVAAAAAWGRP